MDRAAVAAFFAPLQKSKLFNFILRGDLNTCTECMNVFEVLDLDEHGIGFLCVQHEGTPNRNGTRNIHGLLEMKDCASIADVLELLDGIKSPFRIHLSRVAECQNIYWWIDCRKKNRIDSAVLEKGSLRGHPNGSLFDLY